MKKVLITILLVSFNLFSQTPPPPSVFNLQGILRTPTGQAVNDGIYKFKFKLYNMIEGGSALPIPPSTAWEETQDIEVKNGIYNALVGNKERFTGLAFDQTYFVGISVAGGAELSPRIQLTASPYALSLQGVGNKVPNDGPMSFSSNVYHKSNNINRLKFNNDGSNEVNGSTNIYSNANLLQLIGTDHAYIIFYPDGVSGGKGYFGFSAAASNDIFLKNEFSGGSINLNTTGTGQIITNSNLNVGGNIVANNIMVKAAEVATTFNSNSAGISGLDGNKHKKYKVFFKIWRDGGRDDYIHLRFNGDMSSGSYDSEGAGWFQHGGGEQFGAQTSTAILMGRNGWDQQGWFTGEFTVWAAVDGGERVVYGDVGFTGHPGSSSDGRPVRSVFTGYWRNKTDNITSISLNCNIPWRGGSISVYAIP